jgi:hypothetical protein
LTEAVVAVRKAFPRSSNIPRSVRRQLICQGRLLLDELSVEYHPTSQQPTSRGSHTVYYPVGTTKADLCGKLLARLGKREDQLLRSEKENEVLKKKVSDLEKAGAAYAKKRVEESRGEAFEWKIVEWLRQQCKVYEHKQNVWKKDMQKCVDTWRTRRKWRKVRRRMKRDVCHLQRVTDNSCCTRAPRQNNVNTLENTSSVHVGMRVM